MAYLDYCEKTGFCPKCNEERDSGYCYVLLCWEGDGRS
jgi:hypothetical protein